MDYTVTRYFSYYKMSAKVTHEIDLGKIHLEDGFEASELFVKLFNELGIIADSESIENATNEINSYSYATGINAMKDGKKIKINIC